MSERNSYGLRLADLVAQVDMNGDLLTKLSTLALMQAHSARRNCTAL